MPVSQVEQVAVDKLRPHPLNVHTHSKKQIAQINKIIEQVGFINPIAANETGQILAGHGRWLAAKLRGLRTVPVITVSGLSETLQRAYILADNKLTENAGWDRAGLALELNQLTPLLEEIGLDIGLTGFEPAEIDGLLGDLVDPECDPADEVPFPQQQAVSALGDLWQLVAIVCSAAMHAKHVECESSWAASAPPWCSPTRRTTCRSSSVQGRGHIKHRKFAHGSGEMSAMSSSNFSPTACALAAAHSVDGSIHYVFMDWRHIGEILAAGEQVYGAPKNLVVWAKTHGGHGHILSLSARTHLRVQERRRAPHQQLRARPARPQSIKRLDLRRGQHVSDRSARRPGGSSHRQASRADR